MTVVKEDKHLGFAFVYVKSWPAALGSAMEECLREPALLAVPCPGVGIKTRSFSDTSIFKIIPEKNRTFSQSENDSCRASPRPSLTDLTSIEAPIDTSTLKTKRKVSRPRSPFASEKAFDLLSKFTKNDFVAKVTASSPKLRARRTRSKGKENENRESVSYTLTISFLTCF